MLCDAIATALVAAVLTLAVRGAAPGEMCGGRVCARKCCPFGTGYDLMAKSCEPLPPTADFRPPVRHNHTPAAPSGPFDPITHFHFLINKMNCSVHESRIPIGGIAAFDLQMDGQLYVASDKDGKTYTLSPDKYCIDTFVRRDPASGELRHELNALICLPRDAPAPNYDHINSTCMLISCAFILLTVGVYAWLPELRNLHGMVLIAYLLSFFVGFLFLATMQILLQEQNITPNACVTFTFIIYYSLLAAFFWLNVMCYDIWWTFSGKRAVSGRAVSVRARFCRYAAYAFGVPAALTLLLAILEFSIDYKKSTLLPRIRIQTCFISDYSKLLYLYVPIVVLCVANLVFFVLTAIKIAQIKKQTKVLNKKDEQRFSLYVKLFVVMGVNWILEVVSSFFPNADYIWKFTDAYNVLVGLIIFIIFVCKRKTLVMIRQRWRVLRGAAPLSRTQTTSTSVSTRTLALERDDMRMTSATAATASDAC